MNENAVEIYQNYGCWYLCVSAEQTGRGVHVAGPFRTQTEAQRVFQMHQLAQRVFH